MRKTVIFGGVGLLIIGIFAVFGGYTWFLSRQERVLTGTARPNFPYSDYSLEELNELWPQYRNPVETQSAETTYKKLKSALKEGNVDMALECFIGKRREEYKQVFNQAKNNNTLILLADKLEDEIIKKQESCYETRCVYIMKNSKEDIYFVKNANGVWVIDVL